MVAKQRTVEGRTSAATQMRPVYNSMTPAARAQVSFGQFLELNEELMKAQLLSLAEGSEEQQRTLGEAAVREMRNSYDRKFGLLSLSAIPASPVMWARYADGLRGFAVGLDSETPFFRAEVPDSLSTAFREISYNPDFPYLQPGSSAENDIAIFYSKLTPWAYEEEWRLLRRLSDAADTLAGAPLPVHLFDLPAESISCVIFGLLMEEVHQRKLRAILTNPAYVHVRTARVRVNGACLRIEEEK